MKFQARVFASSRLALGGKNNSTGPDKFRNVQVFSLFQCGDKVADVRHLALAL